MGDRGHVEIISEGDPTLYYYTYWGASGLPTDVADALHRGKGRWNDSEYLNRIIFSEMIKDSVLSDTGYGIGFHQHGDVWRIVTIDHVNKTVGIKEINYDKVDWSNYNEDDVVWDWKLEPVPFEVFVYLNSLVTAKE